MQVNGPGARPDINDLLGQMRSLRSQAQGAAMGQVQPPAQTGMPGIGQDLAVQDSKRTAAIGAPGAAQPAGQRPSFSDTIGEVLGRVNQLQQESGAAQTAFIKGERTDLVNVMVAVQKSSVSFQAVTQVRNRLVEAYKDVMNMPI